MPELTVLSRRSLALFLATGLALGGVAACGKDSGSSSAATSTAGAGSPVTTAGPGTTTPVSVGMTATGAWARSSPSAAAMGVAYVTLTNTTAEDDALVRVSVPANVAATAELHQTAMGDGGMMSMAPVTSIPVAAGATVELQPGGYHVMLMDLAKPLTADMEIPLTLTFERSGDVNVIAEVRDA